jgi:hypothetical protein
MRMNRPSKHIARPVVPRKTLAQGGLSQIGKESVIASATYGGYVRTPKQ